MGDFLFDDFTLESSSKIFFNLLLVFEIVPEPKVGEQLLWHYFELGNCYQVRVKDPYICRHLVVYADKMKVDLKAVNHSPDIVQRAR